ncbi:MULTISPECIES: excalibur calcium-binding domain-containing protein [Mycobacterium]
MKKSSSTHSKLGRPMIRTLLVGAAIAAAGIGAAPLANAGSDSSQCVASQGMVNIPRSDPHYRADLDLNHNGIACEFVADWPSTS